jgi:hypothetical protein
MQDWKTITAEAVAKSPTVYSVTKLLAQASPGDRVTYHVGMLVNDRHVLDDDGAPVKNSVDDIARAVNKLAKAGDIVLHQQYLRDLTYNYFAIKQ